MAWDKDDMRYGRKVRYTTLGANQTTAYLDGEIVPDVYVGVNKYTDEPISVLWTGEKYVEVDEFIRFVGPCTCEHKVKEHDWEGCMECLCEAGWRYDTAT